jgi:hypothetical protein
MASVTVLPPPSCAIIAVAVTNSSRISNRAVSFQDVSPTAPPSLTDTAPPLHHNTLPVIIRDGTVERGVAGHVFRRCIHVNVNTGFHLEVGLKNRVDGK